MRGKEQKIYFAGMAVISVVGILILLSVFRYQMNSLETYYKDIFVNATNESERDAFVYEILLKETDGAKAQIEGTVVIGVVVILIFCAVLGTGAIQSIYHKVDKAEELLTEAIEANRKQTWDKDKWESWKTRCNKWKEEGVIGRLCDRIWEVSQIVWQRDEERKEEMMYLKDMMNDISHQLKTPLSSLQIFLDIFTNYIEEDMSDKKEKMQMMVQQGKHQLERMRWLVTGFLKLAQVESGCLEYDMEKKPLYPTIEKSIDALRLKLNQKNQQILCMGDKTIALYHDESWLQEAILNLLKNASEYAPNGSEIKVSIEETSLAVVLSIEDKGPGIEKEHMPKIFNRFYRVPSREKDDGVGIGLALAKSIVERQGGLINVYSKQGENSYTRFVITFLTKL